MGYNEKKTRCHLQLKVVDIHKSQKIENWLMFTQKIVFFKKFVCLIEKHTFKAFTAYRKKRMGL